jgi:molybdopterin synthase sulfur carrier subunit
MPTVLVPPPYRGPTRGEAQVDVAAGTVLDCIEAVEARFPGFRTQVLDADGKVHKFVRLFVNGNRVEPASLDRALSDNDKVEVLAAIAGG